MLLLVTSTLLTLFIASRIAKYRSDRQKVLNLPGLRAFTTPLSPLGALLPTSFWNPGLEWQWYWRNRVYQRWGTETISVLGLLFGEPLIYTTSMVLARQIVSTRAPLEKPEDSTRALSQWGANLFQANGSDWRRHRRIVQPAFNGDIFKLVWKEACGLFDDMIEAEGWKDKASVDLVPVNDITTKFTLKIISRCAFGNYSSWNSEGTEQASPDDDTSTMGFSEALEIASSSSIIRLITPNWMYRLPIQLLHRVDIAHRKLNAYMKSLVATRRAELSGHKADTATPRSKQDLFSLMVESSEEEEGTSGMSDEELIGNTFLMLFAGHDTTSQSLVAAFGFLAVYQDIQQELYEEINAEATVDPGFTFDVYPRLVKTQAAFLEAGRLFPAAFIMIRRTTEDMVFTTDDPHFAPQGGRIPVEKGTTLIVDMVGMHYNERYFPDPEEFRPSRWYNVKENDMSMFSFGSRACIGRRFALTEAVCFLSRLLLSWRIEPILRSGETSEQWRQRVLVAKVKMTLGLGDVPVRLVPRTLHE